MRMPEGFNEAIVPDTNTVSKQIPAGGYICIICGAREGTTSNGRAKIEVALDIAEGPYKGFYQKKYINARNYDPDVKYPCIFHQGCEGNSMPYFKALLQAVEASNPGYKFNWNDPNNVATLGKKYVGFIFGEEEFTGRDGQPRITVKPTTAVSTMVIRSGDFVTPESKSKQQAPAKPIEEDADFAFEPPAPAPAPMYSPAPQAPVAPAPQHQQGVSAYSSNLDVPF